MSTRRVTRTQSKACSQTTGQPSTSARADPLCDVVDNDEMDDNVQEIYLSDQDQDDDDDGNNSPASVAAVDDVEFVQVDDFFAEKFHCSRCNVEFVSVEAHIREHHSHQRVVIEDEVLPVNEEAFASKTVPFSGRARKRRFPFPCALCGYMFTSNDDRDVHMQVQHDKISVRSPQTREQLLAEKRAKRGTANNATGERKAKVPKDEQPAAVKKNLPQLSAAELESSHCEECNTQFPNVKSLKLHVRMHLPPKAITYEDALESDRDHLATDPAAENAGEEDAASAKDANTFYCEQCDKSYAAEFQAIHEQSHAVPSDERHRCITCNITFESRVLLDMHTVAHKKRKYKVHDRGDTPLPYVCTFCGKAFARPHEKVKHERIHTGEKPHGCEICGKTFRVAFCLTLHMRSHSNARPYVCPHCDKRYKTSSVYNHHMQTHSDARPYQCTFCPKAFKTAVQLAGHKNSHTKPFPCSECNRPFSTLYAVRLHMKVHERTNNKMTHVCLVCGASYTREFALNNHMKEQHPDEPASTAAAGKPAAGKRRVAAASNAEDVDGDVDDGDGDYNVDAMMETAAEEGEEAEHMLHDDQLLADDMIVEMQDAEVVLREIEEQFVGEEIVVDWMK